MYFIVKIRCHKKTPQPHSISMKSEITILQELIKRKSYLSTTTSESRVADFIYTLLEKEPTLRVEKQFLPDSSNRFNVLAYSSKTPKLLLAAHMDTVEPRQDWTFSPFKAKLESERLYGLGAYDNKAGLAAMIAAAQDVAQGSFALLFYCDEEYDFNGMRTFVKDCPRSFKSIELAVVSEPTDLGIRNNHRGLIELKLFIHGKSGHAADPESGNNAIRASLKAVGALEEELQQKPNPELGYTTLNVAYIAGGLKTNVSGSKLSLSQQGNNIPDYCELILELRTSSTEVNATFVIQRMEELLKRFGVKLDNYHTRHDLGPLITDRTQLKKVEKSIEDVLNRAEYIDSKTFGYSDGQILQEKLGFPTIYIGPSGDNMHAANEWVDVFSVSKLKEIYKKIILSYCNN